MLDEIRHRRWPWIVAAAGMIFVLLSLQPVHTLREQPPAEFQEVAAPAGVDRAQWSSAYWERARLIQLKYSFGTQLPDDAVEDFHISEEKQVAEGVAERARRLYWDQLRKIWLTPSPWKKTYTFSLAWIRSSIEKGADWVVDAIKGVWRSVHD